MCITRDMSWLLGPFNEQNMEIEFVLLSQGSVLIAFFVSLKLVQSERCVQRLPEIDLLPEWFCYHCFNLLTRSRLCSIYGFAFFFPSRLK